MIPDLSNPQSWNRYSYVTNRPVNFNDPTGHAGCDGDYQGSCADWAKSLEYPDQGGRVKKPPTNIRACDTIQSIVCLSNSKPPIPNPEFDPNWFRNSSTSSSNGKPNADAEDLLNYWDNVVSPFNDGLDLYDIYRFSSSGGWKASKTSLNLGPLEGVAAGARQWYGDGFYEEKSFAQRGVRALLAGAEAYATDIFSDKVGDAGKVAGLFVGAAPGAVGGKLFGNTLGTRIGESFWSKIINPWISNNTPLGVFP